MTQPHRYTFCKRCGKHRDQAGGELSATGLCHECGVEKVNENVAGLVLKEGMPWARWLLGTAAYLDQFDWRHIQTSPTQRD